MSDYSIMGSKTRDNGRRRHCILSARHFRHPYATYLRRGTEKGTRPASEEDSKVSNPASLVSTDTPWIVPFERNPHFTGREFQLTVNFIHMELIASESSVFDMRIIQFACSRDPNRSTDHLPHNVILGSQK